MTKEIVQPPNLYQRIIHIMGELDYIAKGDKTVNGQYRFVSHDQVTAKVHPLLVKHGVAVIPTVHEIVQEANRTMVKLAVVFVNSDNPSEQFTSLGVGFGVDNGDKGPGKAISYAYKYVLLKVFCLETGDDPDNVAEAVYEPAKCHQFDLQLPPDMSDKDRAKLAKFLDYSSKVMKKHVEEVKQEALSRMPEFIAAYKNWNPKKKDES